jgi:hypothetical protein
MKKIEITPEWILDNLTTTHYCKDEMVLVVCNDEYH